MDGFFTKEGEVATRILIYGVTGSGKTTLAGRVSEITGIPWESVDDLAWLPGWQSTSDEDQVAQIGEVVARERWILDTAYGKWLEVPLVRAQLILALDYPRWFSLMRLVRRTWLRIRDQNPVCNGNRETLRGALSKDSIILWHFRSFSRKRERIRRWAADPDGPRVVVFRSARQTEAWLREAQKQKKGPPMVDP